MHFGSWGLLYFMAPKDSQRNAKMHFGGLENCILVCGALSFDGLGEWTKKTKNAFWRPGEMHFGL